MITCTCGSEGVIIGPNLRRECVDCLHVWTADGSLEAVAPDAGRKRPKTCNTLTLEQAAGDERNPRRPAASPAAAFDLPLWSAA